MHCSPYGLKYDVSSPTSLVSRLASQPRMTPKSSSEVLSHHHPVLVYGRMQIQIHNAA